MNQVSEWADGFISKEPIGKRAGYPKIKQKGQINLKSTGLRQVKENKQYKWSMYSAMVINDT